MLIKDLSKLGREIKNLIIVDNVAQNFSRQQENGIVINSWYDDMEDTALKELGPILEQIRKLGYTDMRKGLIEIIGGESAAEESGSGSSPNRTSGLSVKRESEEHKLIDDIFVEVKQMFL